MYLQVEVTAQDQRREWPPPPPGTCTPTCNTEQPSPCAASLLTAPAWVETRTTTCVPEHELSLHAAAMPMAPAWVDQKTAPLSEPTTCAACASCSCKPRASILAMGRATPPHQIEQTTYTDWYFNITNCSHMDALKHKMQRICDRSGIKNRYSILTEEFLKEHPEFYTPGEPSLEQRNSIFAKEVPKLAHVAAEAAIKEWGRPTSEITHLIVATLTGVAIPGADVMLTKSLGLRPNVKRVMLYMLGCYAGITALRVAKDLAENNPGSRILICCSELAAPTFRAPNERHPYDLVGTALFGDGASGVIVGALSEKPPSIERPIYYIHWVGEVLAPDSEKIIEGTLKLEGLQFYLDRSLPRLVSENIGDFCRTALDNAPEKPGFNDVFYAVHAGGPAILNAVEEVLQLAPEKLAASREILLNYGNISASTVLFVLDELRRKDSAADVQEACQWGIAIAFGPGVTIEGTLLERCL